MLGEGILRRNLYLQVGGIKSSYYAANYFPDISIMLLDHVVF